MSKFLKTTVAASLASAFFSSAVLAEPLGLGRQATDEEVAAWNIDIRPDGQGLPVGRGNVADGEEIFAENCAICHGDFGEGVDRWPVLSGGQGSLTDARPVKTIGSYWPYLSTVYDYIHRAMPFGNARSLSDDEIYAIVAYLLYVNDMVDDDFELSNENFTSIKMPNEPNFFMDDRDTTEVPAFSHDVCMENCKPEVEITKRAAIVDVTPEETAAKAAAQDAKAEESAPAAADGQTTTEAAAEPAATEQATDAPDPELIAKGEKVFKKCKACHQIGEGASNRTGPILTGVVGRPAASVEGFKYSKGMKEMAGEGLIWDEANLDQFLTKPKAFVKKTKMGFAGLKKEGDRAAIIAYLKSVAP